MSKARWVIRWGKLGKVWFHVWRPAWHEGRGRYVSIGLWFVAIYRGY